METASLRIKFTPLMNNIFKTASKYCLDIVPEVTCVQNLDKISWRQENELIEYTIPMTYKVILKRWKKIMEDDKPADGKHLEKTYHSCVDLLPPSSMTNFDFASGDVTRMISDTVIFGKISAKIYNSKTVINNNVIEKYVSGTILLSDHCPIPENRNNAQLMFHEDVKRDINAISKSLNTSKTEIIDKHSVNKITNTDITLKLCKVTETLSVEEEIYTKNDAKHKLSVSPICSIDTNMKPFADNAEVISDLKVDHKYQFSNTFEFSYNAAFNTSNVFADNTYKTYKRELPEARVAKFIKKMEMEISPLKIMLNDLIQKCMSLGCSKKQCGPQNIILYTTVPSPQKKVDQVEKYWSEKQPKSNRVIYSIVFDG